MGIKIYVNMFLKHISVNNKLYLHLIFSVEIFPLCT